MQTKSLFKPVFFICLLAVALNAGAAEKTSFKFFFGSEKAQRDFTQVLPMNIYNKETGFGFSVRSLMYERKSLQEVFQRLR